MEDRDEARLSGRRAAALRRSGAVILGLTLLLSACQFRAPAGGSAAQTAAAGATPATATNAAPPSVDEISRHPSEMPHSTDYALYDNGEYSQLTPRNGPMTHTVNFTVKEVRAEVVPGTFMDYWTFDGKVPGPMIRARVGDTVDFSLNNPKSGVMPHNVDFHAVTGPGGGSVVLDTAPGAVSHLKIKLLNPGIFIYHCAFPDIPTHISHGMYGLVVVEPEGGLPKVDHEYYLMQSEFYTTKGASQPYTALENQGLLQYSAENGDLEEPTFVVYNGRPDAVTGQRAMGVYGGDEIKTGQTVRLFVGDIGPNLVSSFHVIGAVLDKVYVDGSFALVNKAVQTTLIPAGGAIGAELKFVVPGDYLALDHSIFRMHKGAVTTLHVTGPANPDVYDPIQYSKGLRG